MTQKKQPPIAVVGLSCRLPGGCNSPETLWRFLLDGGIADTSTPSSRFNIDGHYDGTLRPWTMRSPGAMFINQDVRDIDAGFFGLSQVDATSMDPNQRQLLETVYEALENAGLGLEDIKSRLFGCFVASFTSDYNDMQYRDPEDRTPNIIVGCGRAMLSNRISHFLDIKGPSMTIDTACSGSLITVDLACRYLESGDADGAIVAGCNLFMSPEHGMDEGAMMAASSPSGRCWTFDARADGYMKAEAINCLVLKRLDDAVRDGDPIRAVIRGTSTNSDGWTPGIASPSPDAQSVAIRRAYSRAGISDLKDTAYLECHGTGTQAGDPIECRAASSVFSGSRSDDTPLRIGSIKSNIGHSEPAAGISGMLKAILAVERGIIPGNPTFEIPNPNIDFRGHRLLVEKHQTPWPQGMLRRASVNSFGYGGSNAHAIIEDPAAVLLPNREPTSVTSYATECDDMFMEDDVDKARRLLVFSANDETSLKASVKEHIRHLSNPVVKVQSADLAYTLSQRRTRHFFRAYAISNGPMFKESQVTYGKLAPAPRIGFIFTGQGAQWPMMGRELIQNFPVARGTIDNLDRALQSMSDPPSWKLMNELCEPRSPEHMRLPEFSQPLVTALQLALLAVLKDWGLEPAMVAGHSSGEIAAAIAAGCISPEEGIKVAYLRGKAPKHLPESQQVKLGMLAVGLGPQECEKYLPSYDRVSIACINSPKSITLAGQVQDLEVIEAAVKADGHFARLLMVDMAYHSKYMADAAEGYRSLLETHCPRLSSARQSKETKFFSTVTGRLNDKGTDIDYWIANMLSPVLFSQGISAMIEEDGVDHLIELGPSGALSGPIKQIKQELKSGPSSSIQYSATLDRGQNSTMPLYDLAGKMYFSGVDVDMTKVNALNSAGAPKPRVIVDLPNYQWNHSTKTHWHESLASKDWRYRPFPPHDLLGSKVLGTSWDAPTWKRRFRLKDASWVSDHKIGTDIVFPASAYIAMAVEGMFQKAAATNMEPFSNIKKVAEASYRLRDVRFLRALVIEENSIHHMYTFLNPAQVQKDTWFHFRVSSLADDVWTEHCTGFVRIEPTTIVPAERRVLEPLRFPSSPLPWYKAMRKVGFNFGPKFQNLGEIEVVAGQRESRVRINFPEHLAQTKQSQYTIHPAVFDVFFQAGISSMHQNHRTLIAKALVPRLIDNILISPGTNTPTSALALTNAEFTEGRPDKVQNYQSNLTVYDEVSGHVITSVQGLHYTELLVPEAPEAALKLLRTVWKPDISLLQNNVDLEVLAASDDGCLILSAGLCLPHAAAYLMSLLKHKMAAPSVLDMDITTNQEQAPSQVGDTAMIKHELSAFGRYVSTHTTSDFMLTAQTRLSNPSGMEFHIYDPLTQATPSFETETKFDLVILRVPPAQGIGLEAAFRTARGLCTTDGFVVLVQQTVLLDVTDSGSESETVTISRGIFEPESMLHSIGLNVRAKHYSSEPIVGDLTCTVYLCAPVKSQEPKPHTPDFPILDLAEGKSAECSTLIQSLQNLGCTGSLMGLSEAVDLPVDASLIILDDPHSPLLARITQPDWILLQRLLTGGRTLLWVTSGSQLTVSSPSNALIHGFARTLRNEDSTISITTLDLSSYTHMLAAQSILRVMKTIRSRSGVDMASVPMETEYCERGGAVHVSRVTPDDVLFKTAAESQSGRDFQDMAIQSNTKMVRMYCERIGAVDSLHFNEVPAELSVLGDGHVEVDIQAAGLNFKDIATSLGIVLENEHLLGLEGAGIIRRVGKNVSTYRAGDKVIVHNKGCFANRNCPPKERVFLLPKGMSFEEGAAVSIPFFTAVYSMMEITQVKRGQSVLIHSAAGGVGLASIQICRYMGAEIYVTAGNEEKRRFLEQEQGIPRERIFSSRNTAFGASIRKLTNGRGVDFVLNFLTGDLLDESWRLLADNGTLLEIGKKDIVDRNALSMEPFNRNCSFRGIDISRPSVLDDLPLVDRILQQIRHLLLTGHITPISPRKVFSFNQIQEALRYMRSGEHMGKIVISHGDADDTIVPIRPAPHRSIFDPDASYLIVGGLKGLCGSLAVYMARCGAKNLIVLSRSGADDNVSRRVIQDLESLGAKAKIAKGDITSLEETTRVFQEATLPIKGIIQGAMVLRDTSFEAMTFQDLNDTLSCKLAGTWNLHKAAAEQMGGDKLEFFTMLSSLSGVIGSRGQANYAAGNTFQDAFASYRHSLGLAAHTVDLGIIEDVGYMSEHQDLTDRLLGRTEMLGIDEKQLHDILQLSILQQTVGLNKKSSSQMITGLSFPLAETSTLLVDKRFHSLRIAQHATAAESTGGNEENDRINALHAMVKASVIADKLIVETVKVVNKEMVRLLGLSTDMEDSKPLSSYGIDSLAAVDLRNWLKVRLGIQLTTLDVLNSASLLALCTKVVERLLASLE